jgi:hypothetical protein
MKPPRGFRAFFQQRLDVRLYDAALLSSANFVAQSSLALDLATMA